MFVNKLKMDGIAEAVKKCMDEADLEETGLRKAAYAAHTKGEKMFSFKGKTYPVKVQGEEVSYGKEIKEASCEDEVKKHEKRLHGKDGEVSKHVDKMHKEELSPKQKKIAKLNHPKDEIDAGDLAKLRGEETEFELTEGSYADLHKKWGDTHNIEYHSHTLYPKHTVTKFDNEKAAESHAKKTGGTVRMSISPKEMKESEKVATTTGMRVYGSSYGDSAKARRDQLKRPVDDTKGPKPSELAQMAKVKKEEFFKDKLISNYIEEEAQFEAELNEVLSKDASAGDWIHDFVHSDNPKFAGKSVKKRQKMALAAYYAKKRNESVEDGYPVTTDTLAGRMPGGMSNSFKQFKLRVRPSDKESEDPTNVIPANRPAHMTARDPHVGRGGLVSIPAAGVVRKEEVELDEATPPKNTDIADKSYLKDMGKKPTVKSDLKNFGRFLAGKKETNEAKQPEQDNVPFEKPYNTTSDPVTTDKSGAKHTPMSRARDLAQSAMKRVKTEMLGKAPGNNG